MKDMFVLGKNITCKFINEIKSQAHPRLLAGEGWRLILDVSIQVQMTVLNVPRSCLLPGPSVTLGKPFLWFIRVAYDTCKKVRVFIHQRTQVRLLIAKGQHLQCIQGVIQMLSQTKAIVSELDDHSRHH